MPTSYIHVILTINQLERIFEPLPGLQLMRSFDEGTKVFSVLTFSAQLMVVTMIFTDAFSSSLHLDMKNTGTLSKEGEDPLNRQIWWNLTPPPNPQNLETQLQAIAAYLVTWLPCATPDRLLLSQDHSRLASRQGMVGNHTKISCISAAGPRHNFKLVTKGTCDCKHRLSIF